MRRGPTKTPCPGQPRSAAWSASSRAASMSRPSCRRRRSCSRRLPVLGGEQQRGERFEGRYELGEFVGREGLIRLGGQVIGERLDPLVDGAARVAEPTV